MVDVEEHGRPGDDRPVAHEAPAVPATMDVSDVRRHHLSVVLRHLVDDGERSRARIAAETGLTKATVSALVADLLDRRLVEELDTLRDGRVGRPGTQVAAAGRHIGALGLEIDVDHVAAAVVDLSGTVRSRARLSGDHRSSRSQLVFGRLSEATDEVLAASLALGIDLVGGALSVPGLVEPASGRLFVAPNLHWFDADLLAGMAHLGLPGSIALTVDNEANLAALAELRRGAGRGLSSFVYVSGGVGIGASIVLDGRLARGSHGFAGELGHIVVDPTGRPCACGARGCLETIAGTGAGAAPEQIAEALARALRSVVHILDPEAIVLGGSFTEHGEDLVADVAERLHARTLGARWAPCDVRPAALGADAALLGAATVALDAVLADPTTVPARPSTRSA